MKATQITETLCSSCLVYQKQDKGNLIIQYKSTCIGRKYWVLKESFVYGKKMEQESMVLKARQIQIGI